MNYIVGRNIIFPYMICILTRVTLLPGLCLLFLGSHLVCFVHRTEVGWVRMINYMAMLILTDFLINCVWLL